MLAISTRSCYCVPGWPFFHTISLLCVLSPALSRARAHSHIRRYYNTPGPRNRLSLFLVCSLAVLFVHTWLVKQSSNSFFLNWIDVSPCIYMYLHVIMVPECNVHRKPQKNRYSAFPGMQRGYRDSARLLGESCWPKEFRVQLWKKFTEIEK